MKKKLFIIIIIIFIFCILIINFFLMQKRISNFNEKNFTDLAIEIKDNTLSQTGLTILFIENIDYAKLKYDYKYEYTTKYKIEKKIGKYWIELEKAKKSTNESIAYHSTNGKFELNINWKNEYGTLKPGNYRIILEIINVESHKAEYISTKFYIK